MEDEAAREAAVRRKAIDTAKNTMAAIGESEGVDMEDELTQMELAFPSTDLDGLSAPPVMAPSTLSVTSAAAPEFVPVQQAHGVATDPSPPPFPSPATSTTTQTFEAQARERARQRIRMAKLVGARVKVYKDLEQIHLKWIERHANGVMSKDAFKRTKTASGVLWRVKHILREEYKPIRIPDCILENLQQVLDDRYKVADDYLREQARNPTREMHAANLRHKYYRACLEDILNRLVEYKTKPRA
ncbi:hypothetical protein PRZ48_003764 [Zasmidium cellare]|uniref:Uncharacterized protein n=1 Tax=Zasmidium cellare TaxID=395010 RepID=A0ABR0EWT0_ZASCE|nr:hypothetical protein PRZ48_003764 [Zasmidium cellare]